MNDYSVKDDKIVRSDGKKYEDLESVCRQLNDLEMYRINKGKEIQKLRDIIELQADVIDGVKAYIKLKERWY